MFNNKVFNIITGIFTIAGFIFIFFGSDNPSYGRLASLLFFACMGFAFFYYGFIKPKWINKLNELNNSFDSAIKENRDLFKEEIDKINDRLDYIKINDKLQIHRACENLYFAINRIEEKIGLQKTNIDIFKQDILLQYADYKEDHSDS